MSVLGAVLGVVTYAFGYWLGRIHQRRHTQDALALCHDYKAALESQREATARALRSRGWVDAGAQERES